MPPRPHNTDTRQTSHSTDPITPRLGLEFKPRPPILAVDAFTTGPWRCYDLKGQKIVSFLDA